MSHQWTLPSAWTFPPVPGCWLEVHGSIIHIGNQVSVLLHHAIESFRQILEFTVISTSGLDGQIPLSKLLEQSDQTNDRSRNTTRNQQSHTNSQSNSDQVTIAPAVAYPLTDV